MSVDGGWIGEFSDLATEGGVNGLELVWGSIEDGITLGLDLGLDGKEFMGVDLGGVIEDGLDEGGVMADAGVGSGIDA